MNGFLDNIKGKLGFAADQDFDEYDEEYYDEGYQSVEDDSFDDQGGYGGYRPSQFDQANTRGAGSAHPPLVSLDDVKSRTQVPERLGRDPLPDRRGGSSFSSASSRGQASASANSFRNVEHAADYMRSSETSDINLGQSPYEETRSAGYDSLFSSTQEPSRAVPAGAPAGAFDPYETFSGSGVSSHNPSRGLTVIKPMSYGEVERIAKTIKAGDAVVLCLRNTPDQLVKRVLDFSFGVSSALDASVDCIAEKVFVVNKGRTLSEEELTQLRNQGVL